MTQLQINSPEMQDIFKTKFNSNQDKFMEFILSFVQDNKNIVDNYFDKKKKFNITYKKLNPMENSLRGVFNQYADSSKLDLEESAWKNHIMDKFKND